MSITLPACPALELSPGAAKLSAPVVVAGQGSNVYRAPAGFTSDDLARPAEPPQSLGQFWPQPK